jgi:formylglycine-generating enzyme required for sulfatase activity
VKYRVSGGAWRHATLAGSGHVAPSGAVVDVPGDRVGAFVYRSSSGYGTFAADGVGLQWDYVADGVSAGASVEVQPFGIEMVFVPQGSFSVGSGGSSTGEFRAGGTSSTPFVVSSQSSIVLGNAAGQLNWTSSTYTGSPSGSTSASFPTGYGAYYAMKYQVTQGQYVDFLNTLSQAQADVRKYTDDRYRYAVTGSSVGSYASSLPFVAMNYISWADGAAFADWAGLRPLTELEVEKVSRGPLSPVANEYAWGSTSITQATGLVNEGTITETPTPATANANYASGISGPVRVGAFAAPGRSRRDAGAGFYGALELSGSLWERPVTVGNAEGRAFAGTHGDGSLDSGGNANVSSWPGSNAGGAGFRGGNWNGTDDNLRVSNRYIAASTYAFRNIDFGWRGARSAP